MSQLNPEAPLAITKLVRHHNELKLRKGLLQSKPTEFFRYKRFVRALKSAEYSKKSQNQPDLYPSIKKSEAYDEYNEDRIKDLFVSLIKTQLIVPVIKLHSEECKEHGLKPSKDHPSLVLTQKALLQDDAYYAWNYNPKTWMDTITVFGIIIIILSLVCFPLWPRSMKRSSYYLSMAALGLLGLFFVLAIIRLIVYLISLAFIKEKGGFWLFPNLFEDCGVLESFKPLYGVGEEGNYTYLKKLKRRKRKQAKTDTKSKKAITEVPTSEEKKDK